LLAFSRKTRHVFRHEKEQHITRCRGDTVPHGHKQKYRTRTLGTWQGKSFTKNYDTVQEKPTKKKSSRVYVIQERSGSKTKQETTISGVVPRASPRAHLPELISLPPHVVDRWSLCALFFSGHVNDSGGLVVVATFPYLSREYFSRTALRFPVPE